MRIRMTALKHNKPGNKTPQGKLNACRFANDVSHFRYQGAINSGANYRLNPLKLLLNLVEQLQQATCPQDRVTTH